MFTDVIKRWERSNALLFTTESLILQTLLKHMGTQNHRVLVMWALETAIAPLHVLEAKYLEELRPRRCLEISTLWAQGNIKMPLAKKAIQAAHAAAREIDDGAYRALCMAIGHAEAYCPLGPMLMVFRSMN